MYMYIHICIYVYMYICIYAYMHICVYVYMYIRICMCIYNVEVYVQTDTHTHTQTLRYSMQCNRAHVRTEACVPITSKTGLTANAQKDKKTRGDTRVRTLWRRSCRMHTQSKNDAKPWPPN